MTAQTRSRSKSGRVGTLGTATARDREFFAAANRVLAKLKGVKKKGARIGGRIFSFQRSLNEKRATRIITERAAFEREYPAPTDRTTETSWYGHKNRDEFKRALKELVRKLLLSETGMKRLTPSQLQEVTELREKYKERMTMNTVDMIMKLTANELAELRCLEGTLHVMCRLRVAERAPANHPFPWRTVNHHFIHFHPPRA